MLFGICWLRNKECTEFSRWYKKQKFNNIIVDGTYFKPIMSPDDEDEIITYECIPQGDNNYINIAAASIIAKDYHDNEIINIVKENPDLNKYDLLKNMGYATVNHRNAIKNNQTQCRRNKNTLQF